MKIIVRLCFLLLAVAPFTVSAKDVNVLDFGAKGDSVTLNTTFIQAAIDACAKDGGGKVIFPKGKFLTGTIELKSGVHLWLNEGSWILGSLDVNDYRNLDPFLDGLGTQVGWALVVAVDASNIGIEGKGAIDGQGAKLKAKQVETDTRPEGQRWGRRPFLLRIVRCKKVMVQDVSLYYSAAWTSHYFQTTDLQIKGIRILSKGVAHNDGIDIDGCQDVKISDCDIVSGDDALCFKTTSSKMACRNIEVKNMRLKSSQGAIKMGTESMADFENISISHCFIYDTNNGGIKLLSVDGAHIRQVNISDIEMNNVKTPMLFRLGSRLSVFRKDQDTKQVTGSIEHVYIKNVKAMAANSSQLQSPSAILITGVPGFPIRDLRLENIEVTLAGGGSAEQAAINPPEAIDKYPEVKTFGPVIPAYAVWARHTEGLSLDHIIIHLKTPDNRPAFHCEDAQKLVITNCSVPASMGQAALIHLVNILESAIKNNSVTAAGNTLVRVDGDNSHKISIQLNKPANVKTIWEKGMGVKEDAVSIIK